MKKAYKSPVNLLILPANTGKHARDTNTIVISVSDIPNQYLTFQDDKTTEEDESVSRSQALFMEAPEKRELMP